MVKYTASINVFQGELELSYSIRLWRVGAQNHTFRRPQMALTGCVPLPVSADPTRWLQEVLAELRLSLDD